MSLGARLAELRLRKGDSLQEVADAVGVSKAHIWALEKEKSDNPSLDLLKKLADHFAVPLGYLAGLEPSATVDDAQAQQFFRDFKSLSEPERGLLMQTIELLKKNKGSSDGST